MIFDPTLQKVVSKNKIKTLYLMEKVLQTSDCICPYSKIITLDKILKKF